MPGHGGIVIATNASGACVPGAKLERRPEGNRDRRSGSKRLGPFDVPMAAPERALPGDHVPDLLDRAMRDRVGDAPCGELEMRHAPAGEGQEQADGRAVRRGRVGRCAQRLRSEVLRCERQI